MPSMIFCNYLVLGLRHISSSNCQMELKAITSLRLFGDITLSEFNGAFILGLEKHGNPYGHQSMSFHPNLIITSLMIIFYPTPFNLTEEKRLNLVHGPIQLSISTGAMAYWSFFETLIIAIIDDHKLVKIST